MKIAGRTMSMSMIIRPKALLYEFTIFISFQIHTVERFCFLFKTKLSGKFITVHTKLLPAGIKVIVATLRDKYVRARARTVSFLALE